MRLTFAGTRVASRVLAASRGFTLVELMIAVLLGLIIVAGLTNLMLAGNRNYHQDELISRLQDELRFAMTQITSDVEMAGFWGLMLNPSSVALDDASLSIASDCGPLPGGTGAANTWTYGNRQPVAYLNNPTASSAATGFPCIASSDFLPGTDVIALKRIDGKATISIASGGADSRIGMNNGHVYLKTNGVQGALFKQVNDGGTASDKTTPTVAGAAFAAPYGYWEYMPHVYYIRRYSTSAGDDIPSLCRERLTVVSGNPVFESECLARGIEDMQFEFGIDSTGDGVADFFQENPDAANLAMATAIRITLLARSEAVDPMYSNPKTYQLTPTYSVTPADHYYRRSMTTTVLLRNPAALRRLSTR